MATGSVLGAQGPASNTVCPEGSLLALFRRTAAVRPQFPPQSFPNEQLGCSPALSFIFVDALSHLGNQIVSFKFNLNFCLKNQPEISKGIQKMHYTIHDQMTFENIALLYLEILDQNSHFFYCEHYRDLKGSAM